MTDSHGGLEQSPGTHAMLGEVLGMARDTWACQCLQGMEITKGILFNCIISKNIGKYGTILEFIRWQSSPKERILLNSECESHGLGYLSHIELLKRWLANSYDFREYHHQRVNSGIVSSWFLPCIHRVQQRYCLMMIITLTETLLEAKINRLFKDLKRYNERS